MSEILEGLYIIATSVDERYNETQWIGKETPYGSVVEVKFIPCFTGSYTVTTEKNQKRQSHSSYSLFLEMHPEHRHTHFEAKK